MLRFFAIENVDKIKEHFIFGIKNVTDCVDLFSFNCVFVVSNSVSPLYLISHLPLSCNMTGTPLAVLDNEIALQFQRFLNVKSLSVFALKVLFAYLNKFLEILEIT